MFYYSEKREKYERQNLRLLGLFWEPGEDYWYYAQRIEMIMMNNNHSTFLVTLGIVMTLFSVNAFSAKKFLPAPKWEGFYVGLNAGGIWSTNSTNILSSVVPGSQNSSYPNGATYTGMQSASGATGNLSTGNGGFIGGGQIGYNWQITDYLVGGLETDFQGIASRHHGGSSLNTTPLIGTYDEGAYAFPPGEFYTTTLNSSKLTNYLGTLRGRVGGLATPKLLLMGTAGLAYGNVSSKTTVTQTNNERSLFTPDLAPFTLDPKTVTSGRYSNTRLGWTAGADAEWMFIPNWSAKIGYLYYDLGRVNYTVSPIVTRIPANASPVIVVASQVTTHFSGNIIRVGISYHGFS